MTNRQNPNQRPAGRRGVATVELAACLPVIVLIVFASIEACNMIFLQQSIQTVAYETARFAVSPRSTSSISTSRGQQVLVDRRIKGGAIQLTPNDLSAAPRGSTVVVNVTAPISQNRIMPDYFFGERQLQAQVTMMRE